MKNDRITPEKLRSLFRYDPETGRFFWLVSPSRAVKIGDETARSVDDRGYRYLTIEGIRVYAQRAAWMIVEGAVPEFKISFRDENPSNCVWTNLAMNRGIKGHDHHTKEGRAAYQLEYRGANRQKFNDAARQRKYGIEPAVYNAMIAAQDNKCAICRREETEMRGSTLRALAVDHNHKTGAVRELLCTACNKLIGLADENRQTLIEALRYLDKHAGTAPNIIPLKEAK
jgi:hypothetical protein